MEKTTNQDIATLRNLKQRMAGEITISRDLAKSICQYCEDKAVYDKLANYGNFYYKLKIKIQQQESENH